jgi:hypothetical protein
MSAAAAVPLVVWACLTVLGASLIVWSFPMAVRYNAWTTALRERHPRINPPPTPQMRQLNTKIMTWLFRIVGLFLVLIATFRFVSLWHFL